MTPIPLQIMRGAFWVGEQVAPRLAGRAAFELFCRTPARGKPTAGESAALVAARDLMAEAHASQLATPAGIVAVYDFAPSQGYAANEDGVALVLHGWRSRTEHLRAIITALRDRGLRVISIDLPGHGASPGRRLNLAMATTVARAAADRFGPFTALVGHSFGGAVAVNAAVGSIVGIAPVAGRVVTIASPSSMPRLFRHFGGQIGLGPRSQAALHDQVVRVAGRPLSDFESSALLKAHPVPTLVVHDHDDREVDLVHAELMANVGPHVRVKLTRGLGHRRIIGNADVAAEVAAFAAATTVAQPRDMMVPA